MKILAITVLILISSISFSQEKSILSLKNEIKLSGENSSLIENKIEKKRKNPGLAILYSLLLPGMGELYAGNYSSGKYFTIAEAVFWTSYIGINQYGENKRKNYQTFAASSGGVNLDGKDEDYFAIISEHINIEDYNNTKSLERRFDEMYDVNKYYWNWESNENRRTYRGMWVSSESAFNNLRFVAGALVLNRLISAINAVRIAAAFNRNLETETSWNISFGAGNYNSNYNGISIHLNASF